MSVIIKKRMTGITRISCMSGIIWKSKNVRNHKNNLNVKNNLKNRNVLNDKSDLNVKNNLMNKNDKIDGNNLNARNKFEE